MKIPTFIKWPGGKRRLIFQIDLLLPNKIENYHEPFLGGGSVFFHIKKKYNPKNCNISDINSDLINTYKDVRDRPFELMVHLDELKNKRSKKSYYQIREDFNKREISGVKRSAIFIYLNKSCFNGIYRVNMKGEFNVPHGAYKNPKFYDKEIILEASELLKGVRIKCQDYRKSLSSIKKSSFVYLDPCYDPLKKTSFAHYTPERFSEGDREQLAKFMSEARKRGALLMLSNNDIQEVRDIYNSLGLAITEVSAHRCVNSDPSKRGRIRELLIVSQSLLNNTTVLRA